VVLQSSSSSSSSSVALPIYSESVLTKAVTVSRPQSCQQTKLLTRVTDNNTLQAADSYVPGRRHWKRRATGSEWWRKRMRRVKQTDCALRCHWTEYPRRHWASAACRRRWDLEVFCVVLPPSHNRRQPVATTMYTVQFTIAQNLTFKF